MLREGKETHRFCRAHRQCADQVAGRTWVNEVTSLRGDVGVCSVPFPTDNPLKLTSFFVHSLQETARIQTAAEKEEEWWCVFSHLQELIKGGTHCAKVSRATRGPERAHFCSWSCSVMKGGTLRLRAEPLKAEMV